MTDKAKMGRQSRSKGQRWERAVAAYLGWEKDSRGGYTGHDVSDGSYDAECRDTQSGAGRALTHLKDAEKQLRDGNIPVAIMKVRQRPTGDAVVALRLSDFRALLGYGKRTGEVEGADLHHAGVLAIAVGDGILVVTDITEPYGTIVVEHTSQGFLIRQKGSGK